MQAYDAFIASRKAAAAAGAESEGLPEGLTLEDASVLLQPGTKDGAIKVIRENGAGVAYSWSVSRCAFYARLGLIETILCVFGHRGKAWQVFIAVKVSKEAYEWCRQEWQKIGEVVGGPASGGDTMAVGGKMYGGQQWDYVFDVDAEEGAAPRKLPANRGEDPYVVADRFLAEEGLPISYRHAPVAW